ncbi:hypothetical protein ACJX0J_019552, partial [Zea mays]
LASKSLGAFLIVYIKYFLCMSLRILGEQDYPHFQPRRAILIFSIDEEMMGRGVVAYLTKSATIFLIPILICDTPSHYQILIHPKIFHLASWGPVKTCFCSKTLKIDLLPQSLWRFSTKKGAVHGDSDLDTGQKQ